MDGRLLFVFFLFLLALGSAQATLPTLIADSRPESRTGCSVTACNPFSNCRTWQSGSNVLSNYPNGVGPLVTPLVVTRSTYQTGYGWSYYLPWPSTSSQQTSGLVFSGRSSQTITFNAWFPVALLVHVNYPISLSDASVCNILALTIPFSLSDGTTTVSTSFDVAFTIEETPNDPCSSWYPGVYNGNPPFNYPPDWSSSGLGVCPYGPTCTATAVSCGQAQCLGTCTNVVCPQSGCYDRVQISGGYTNNQILNLGGKSFFMAVLGFTSSSSFDSSSVPIRSFITVENSNSVGYLYARIVQTCTVNSDCNDDVACTVDLCLPPSDSRNIWGYGHNFCFYTFDNSRCTNGCALSTCTPNGCTAIPTSNPPNNCPALSCRNNQCVPNGPSFQCLSTVRTPDPCASQCAGGSCTSDGMSCFCPTTTTTTTTRAITTTTTTTTTTLPSNGIRPRINCMTCSTTTKTCLVSLGYQIVGAPSTDSQGVFSILPSAFDNFFIINGVKSVIADLGQPQNFFVGRLPANTIIYSAGFITVPMTSSNTASVSWTLSGFSSGEMTQGTRCNFGDCLTPSTPIAARLWDSFCAYLEVDRVTNPTTYTFWYQFKVSASPICLATGLVGLNSLVVKLPRSCDGISVLSGSGNCVAPGSSYQLPNMGLPSCVFSSNDGNMGFPMWDAFNIPLNGVAPGTTCTIGVRVPLANCPNVGFATGNSLTAAGRVTGISNVGCTQNCGTCNTLPILGPVPSNCPGNAPPTCTSTQYLDVATCQCKSCPPCPDGQRIDSSQSSSCACVNCPVPSCPRGKRAANNPCEGCVDCPSCSCSPSSADCLLRLSYDTEPQCGTCITCTRLPNRTLTSDPVGCNYRWCSLTCDNINFRYPSDFCSNCIACTPPSCPANQSSAGHSCYCSTCTRGSCPNGQTWANPSDLCNANCVNCPTCPGNSTYSSNNVRCTRGGTCLPCPISTCPNNQYPNPANRCQCINCPNACVNSTRTTAGSCGCTPCNDRLCTLLTNVSSNIDCRRGCNYGTTNGVTNLCQPCVPCTQPNCANTPNMTFGTNFCLGCTRPCEYPTCNANQVLNNPADRCTTCVQCQGTNPSGSGYIACPPNMTLNTQNCSCVRCTPPVCNPITQFVRSDLCNPSCGTCSASTNCPKNKTWDGVSYCNPCIDCPPETLNCGPNQLFTQSSQTNACPTCVPCTSTSPPCPTNTQRDSVNLCQCNNCPQLTCPLGQFQASGNLCAGCQPCPTINCGPTQRVINNVTGSCPSCQNCPTPSCNIGWTFNASNPCAGCYQCIPNVTVPACASGFRVNVNNPCQCDQCIFTLTCPWQTQRPADNCSTSCVPCTPGCDFNTTVPDPETNGCTCKDCTGNTTSKLASDSGDNNGEPLPVLPHGSSRVELCCPNFYFFADFCQNPIFGYNLSYDYGPFQCDCKPCADFITCPPSSRLVNCSCESCPQPECPINTTIPDDFCDDCEPCIEPVCAINYTRVGTLSSCDPCLPCPPKVCTANFTVNYTDLCAPCRYVPPNETQCPFGYIVDPADSTKCAECPELVCRFGFRQNASDPCAGCLPCLPDPCPLNSTRGNDPCANCTECPEPARIDNFRVNYTDLCSPPIACVANETDASCPGNWTVNASDVCTCVPCPEPDCPENHRRTSDDYCDGCEVCPEPVCAPNSTKDVDNCLPCVSCDVPDCLPNYRPDYSDLCKPCIYCLPSLTVCPVNFTLDNDDTCSCKACPDPLCSGNFVYNSSNLCDGCVRCQATICAQNFTRAGLNDCQPCKPCPPTECPTGTQMRLQDNDCPFCQACIPGETVPLCPFGSVPTAGNPCECTECIRQTCTENSRNPEDPCLPCEQCPEPNCPKNFTTLDYCDGCTPCTEECPPGTRYNDPTDLCAGCTPCPLPDCTYGFRLSENECECERCIVPTCPPGFQIDTETGCACVTCKGVICPVGTVLTQDGCDCEVLTVYTQENVTTTRCNQTDRDFCGVCFGRNRTCIGCDGQLGTGRYIDACGVVCGRGDTCAGCTGSTCSICTEDVDLCGVCGGNSTTCDGCDGVPASGAVYDICGVCDGNGTSCLGCFGIPFGPPCSNSITAAEAAAVSVLVALASLGFIILAAILWRMRSKPEILFQEWDNLIADYLTEVQSNPIFSNIEAENNPLFG